ncbi:MAG: alpha/beta hydrolase, partial [Clostridia bacterium]|nr:alpha/beta hydrolase [Clostridia bacterium]
MERTILPPYTPETFPENTTLPEGAKSVHWQDNFGYGVAFKPYIVYAQRDGKELHIHYLTPRNDRTDNPLIVFVQGSAWFQQDLFIHLPEMLRMCQK